MSHIADALERFRRGGELLSTATMGCAGQEADFKPAPEKWSVRQLVCHLADTQIVVAMRIRLILAEENPTLGAFDQEAWARNLDYGKRKISQAIETFRRLRGEDHELMKDLPESAFERTGMHVERGLLTLGGMVEQQAVHLENHVKQIQAVRAAYKEHKAKLAAAAAATAPQQEQS
jgi:hypothetical protein